MCHSYNAAAALPTRTHAPTADQHGGRAYDGPASSQPARRCENCLKSTVRVATARMVFCVEPQGQGDDCHGITVAAGGEKGGAHGHRPAGCVTSIVHTPPSPFLSCALTDLPRTIARKKHHIALSQQHLPFTLLLQPTKPVCDPQASCRTRTPRASVSKSTHLPCVLGYGVALSAWPQRSHVD